MQAQDIEDCKVLLRQMNIKTRQQAQQLVDRYIFPATQTHNLDNIEKTLNALSKV